MNPLMFTALLAGRCDKLNVGSRSRSLNLLVYANRNAISIIFVEKDKKKKRDEHFVLQSLCLPSLSSPGSVERDNY